MAEREPPRALLRVLSAVHVAVFRSSCGRVGARFGGAEFGLLTTTGRRTGKDRTRPLLLVEIPLGTLLVGSNGGSDRPPSWLKNLEANPTATLETAAGRSIVRARIADDVERERLWPTVIERYPQYGRYQRRTARRIPLVWVSELPARP